jgi:phosphotransferase system enzyme I (PtsP)
MVIRREFMYIPSRELRKRYKEIIKEERQLVAGLDAYRDLPAETPDGHRITLYVNTGLNG